MAIKQSYLHYHINLANQQGFQKSSGLLDMALNKSCSLSWSVKVVVSPFMVQPEASREPQSVFHVQMFLQLSLNIFKGYTLFSHCGGKVLVDREPLSLKFQRCIAGSA